jgi:hypothetical protein
MSDTDSLRASLKSLLSYKNFNSNQGELNQLYRAVKADARDNSVEACKNRIAALKQPELQPGDGLAVPRNPLQKDENPARKDRIDITSLGLASVNASNVHVDAHVTVVVCSSPKLDEIEKILLFHTRIS